MPRTPSGPHAGQLHITNGDSAAGAMRAAGVDGDILPWRDVLHEGPVPPNLDLAALSEIRARFLADTHGCDWQRIRADFHARDQTLARFRKYHEVVLWFEHDLYDQLQLLQLLDWFAQQDRGTTKLSLIDHKEFLSEIPLDRLRALQETRRRVTTGQLELGQKAWRAFCAPDPTQLLAVTKDDTESLPSLSLALRRFVEEFPSHLSGLSRTERQILDLVQEGVAAPVELFGHARALEPAPFMGDLSFWKLLANLTHDPAPALQRTDDGPFGEPSYNNDDSLFSAQRLRLTVTGEQLLADREDWIRVHGIDRWLGGVHVRVGNIWRWDPDTQRLVRDH